MSTLLEAALGLPDWWGRNLDALCDCLWEAGEVTLFVKNRRAMTATPFGRALWRALAETAGEKRLVVTSLLTPDETQEEFNRQKAALYERWEKEEVLQEEYLLEDAEVVIAAYGVTARVAKTAIAILRREGIRAGLIRPVTLYPFPYAAFDRLDYGRVRHILCAEMSIPCQVIEDVRVGVAKRAPISTALHSGGVLFTAEDIVDAVRALYGKE